MFVPIRHTVTALAGAVCFLFAFIFLPVAPISMAFAFGGLMCLALLVFSAVGGGLAIWNRTRSALETEVRPPHRIDSRT